MTVITLDHIKVRCIEEGDCWIWQGSTSNGGYPMMKLGRVSTPVRRIVAMLDGRPPGPNRPVVCTCDERKCVRPDHMKLTTRKMVSRKANKTGYQSTKAKRAKISASWRSSDRVKITIEIAREIRSSSESCSVAGARFGIDKTQVSRIRRGQAWQEYASSPFEGLGARE